MKKANLPKLFKTAQEHLGMHVTGLHAKLTKKIYIGTANVRKCDGKCCLGGTTASVKERDKILKHHKLVSKYMTSRSKEDPSSWFYKRTFEDIDFTVGRATYTRVRDGGCVFLRQNDRLCALQVAADKELRSSYELKPAVCFLWPLSVRNHTLEVGHGDLTRRRECCAPVRKGGKRTILQVIGPYEKMIQAMSRKRNSRGGGPCRNGSRKA